MKRKVRIFIYALVAWFVGMAVIAYDFAVSCAASFSSDVNDADWHYWEKKDNVWASTSGIEGFPNDCPEDYPDISSCGAKYSEQFKYRQYLDSFLPYSEMDCVVSADSEIIMYINPGLTQEDLDFEGLGSSNLGSFDAGLVCKDRIYYRGWGWAYGESYDNTWKSNGVWGEQKKFIDFENPGTVSTKGDNFARVSFSAGGTIHGYMTGKMKVFNSFREAVAYLKTGDESGLAWQGKGTEYDGNNIYLNDFQMIVHDSNAYSAYYLEFKYTIPEQLRNAASLKLDIAESFEWCIGLVANTARIPKTFSGTNYIDLLQFPTGFKLYLKDIDAVTDLVGNSTLSNLTRRAVLGSNMGPIDLSALTIDGLGGETLGKVTNSKLYLTCYVVANGKYGVNYTGSVDFLSGSNDMSSYTPDSSGNYKYNGDLEDQGHYFTDVSTDAAGNTTYNYYYYGTDNSKTEITAKDSTDNTVSSAGTVGSIVNNITMPDHIFVSVSGSSSSGGSSSGSDVGNVTIEDDDLSFDSLRESIKDGYGLIDDIDTGEKGDGLVAMMSDLFGYLPASFTGLIMLGMSSVVGIAILRMIFKR